MLPFCNECSQQHHQRLCARVDAQGLLVERERVTGANQVPGRELAQRGFGNAQHQAGVAPDHRMADLVTLPLIEEQHVVGIGHRLVAAHVAQVHAAIRKHEVRVRGAFFSAAMPAGATAIHVRTVTSPESSRRFTVNSFIGVSSGLGRAVMRRV